MEQSRTQKSVQNARVALIFYCINLVLQFFSRRIFIDYLGSEVLGLNTTAKNLLGFLNLAEMGVGAAVAYSLYQPLFNGDKQTIKQIVSVQGWLYRKIALVVIAGAIILLCFFSQIFGKADIPLWYAYATFIVLLFSSLLGYFVNYKQIVLSADQKEYKITYARQGTDAIKITLQILAIRYLSNGYEWWLGLELGFVIVMSIMINIVVKKEYPWLETNVLDGKLLKREYPQITTKTKQLFFHKIGGFVLTQTSPIIIYGYASLTLVAIYGNYMLIVTGVILLVDSLLNGIGAGVGNVIAEGNKTKIKNVFWELTSLRIWMASVICFTLYILGHPFVALWVGEEYIMSNSAFVVLVIIAFIRLSRTNDIFLYAYGLFQDIWAPIVEAVLNIGLSIMLGYFFGLTGILLGVLTSLLLIVCLWKPYFLYKKGFKENVREYFLRLGKYSCVLGVVFILSKIFFDKIINLPSDTYYNWAIAAIIVTLFYGVLSLSILRFIDKPSRDFTKRLCGIIKRKC